MCQINDNLFLQSQVSSDVLQNITRYCSNCYKELELDDLIYLNQETYNYICNQCACEISQQHQELADQESEGETASLF